MTFPEDNNNVFTINGNDEDGKKTGTWTVYVAPDPNKPVVSFTNLNATAELGATIKPEATAKNIENPTAINCAYTCEEPVKVSRCIEIKDVYNKFMEYKEMDLFEIKSFEKISEKELNFVYDDMKRTIEQYDLKNNPKSPMSEFIKMHFTKAWIE